MNDKREINKKTKIKEEGVMGKTKFYSIDVLFQPQEGEDANDKSVLLVDYPLPLLAEDTIEKKPRKLGKRLRGWVVRKKKLEIADLMSAISNPLAQYAINVEREKQVFRQIIEQINASLPLREAGKVYYSLSFRNASRKDKLRLLRSVWTKQAWRQTKTKRQTKFSFAFWWYRRNRLASKKRKC